ncbi:MAG: hypothetical protein OQK56_02415 [Ignavibacteriaceae bacterium]|jgi:hypothetical protein|nr:hypothetical protein [Ignavibacteriaceae bacterium]MCW9066122.1 hypothetical protein [Ignavibacteriaceae bacterium]
MQYLIIKIISNKLGPLCKQIFGFLILIFLIISCGETNYILNEDTPPIDVGFYGFRWTTPMSVVDEEFPDRHGAQPESSLNKYNTANFKNAYFLGERTSFSKFSFGESGLSSVKIIFNTNYLSYEDLFYLLLNKLINVYGEPVELLGSFDFQAQPKYLVRYSWFASRLEIILNPDFTAEINAYSVSPAYGPIFN